MDRKSGANRPPYVAIGGKAAATVAARQRAREEAIAARDADMAQSPVSGLNRTVSVEKDKPLLMALDESKINNKSLCCRHVVRIRCEASLVMEEAKRRCDAVRAMNEAEQRGSAAAIDDAEQHEASVATDNTGQRKSELVNDAEQHEASVATDSTTGQRKSGVISDAGQYGAGVDNDTGTVQGPVSELNGTVSIEMDESLPVQLDKVKSKNKSLKERIRGLSFVRKVVGFFKRIFGSRKVIGPDSKKGGETIVSAHVADSGKLPVGSEEWRIQEANSLFNDVNELGKAMAAEDPPFNDWQNAKTSIKDLNHRVLLLITSFEEEGGSEDLDKKITKIQMGIDWIIFNIQNRESGDDYASRNMRYYNAVLTCYYNAARVALEDSDPELLSQLENFYLQSASCIENEVSGGDAFAAMHNLEIFDDNASQLIDSVDQRDAYEQEFMRRQPIRVPLAVKR